MSNHDGWMMLILVLAVAAGAEEPVWPGETWATRPPAEVGLDEARLQELADYVGGDACVVRHGYLVYSWGDPTKRGDVASACKPWYSHFLFKAIEDGRLPDVDQPVVAWEPRLAGLNPGLGDKDRGIRWRHLANQTSCYGVSEAPGTAFDYNDWQMALFFDTLFLKVYHASFETVDEAVLHRLLTEPLGCQDDPTFMAFGTNNRPGRVGVSPRDFCRFGLLYLRQGDWRGTRLLSREHAVQAVSSPLPNAVPRTTGVEAQMLEGQRTLGSQRVPDNQCDHLGSYSWLWWLNGVDRDGLRHWPHAPLDTFGAFGHGGVRAMAVMPGLDLIISWNNSHIEGREMEDHALGLLSSAAR